MKDDVFDSLRVIALLLPESPAGAAVDRLGGSAAGQLSAATAGWLGRWLSGQRGQRFLDRANVMHPAFLIRPVRLLTLGRLLFPGSVRLLAYYRTGRKWLLPFLYAWHPFHLARRLETTMTWTKSAIREARKTDLAPLLGGRGYRLLPLDNGNYRILPDPDHPSAPAGLVVKQNFWTWPDRQLGGNTIDFFIHVEGRTFHQAMEIIAAGHGYDHSEQELREERGNAPKILR